MKSDPVKMAPSETELWNCENAFEFICPRKWESLSRTESPDIRYCEVCSQNVYLCESPAEFVRQGNLGRCVATPIKVKPKEVYTPPIRLGRISAEGAKQRAEKEKRRAELVKRRQEHDERRAKEWWEGVLDLNPTFNIEEINEVRRKFELPN
jgi:hypothetical protein